MQDFYTQNQNFFLQNKWPDTETLIACAEKQLHIGSNEKEAHRTSLFFLIDSFRHFLQTQNPQNNSSFWIFEEPPNRLYPLQEFQATLSQFLKSPVVWVKGINNNYKHEHFVVLLFLAALRYVTLPPPIRQMKFSVEASKSTNRMMDLFVFNKLGLEQGSHTTAAFAFQVNLLTSRDVLADGKLAEKTLRWKEYQEKSLNTSDELKVYNIRFASSLAYGYRKKSEPTTESLLVHIRPFGVTWDKCGVYPETILPKLLILNDDKNEKKDGVVKESQNSLSTQFQTQMTSFVKASPRRKNDVYKGNYREIPMERGQILEQNPTQVVPIFKDNGSSQMDSQNSRFWLRGENDKGNMGYEDDDDELLERENYLEGDDENDESEEDERTRRRPNIQRRNGFKRKSFSQ